MGKAEPAPVPEIEIVPKPKIEIFSVKGKRINDDDMSSPLGEKTGTRGKILSNNKKKGMKSEVYAFEIEDIRKMLNYFEENKRWIHYLLFTIECNMARRIGDALTLRWEHFYNPQTGDFRSDLLEIVEDKTDKLANPHINVACRNAINMYLEKVDYNPADDEYKRPVFYQFEGSHKGEVLSQSGHLKALKKAAAAVGIKYNIGTHSARKTFGKLSRMIHPYDQDSMEILRMVYNHSDTKTTSRYIGLTKEKINKYYDDIGDTFVNYISGDGIFQETTHPVVSLTTNDLRDIITMAYEEGRNNADKTDAMCHVETITDIMDMVDDLAVK